MNKQITINELRKKLKQTDIPFKLHTKTINMVDLARARPKFLIVKNNKKEELPDFFTETTLEQWQPVIDFLKENLKGKLLVDSSGEKIVNDFT